MSSATLLALMFALICAAAGLLLWRGSQVREGRAHTQRFFDSRVGQGARSAAPAADTRAARAPAAGTPNGQASEHGIARWRASALGAWTVLSDRAGLDEVRTGLVLALAVVVLLALWAGMAGGVLAAVAALVAGSVLVVLWITSRISRRRLKIVRQLPSFLDGIVRLVTLGNSVPAAFQSALQTAEMPLRRCLDDVSQMLRSGVEIDRAMLHIAHTYRIREFELVGAVLRLSVRYGGRADVMLDRMSTFMRDLEQAERELSAMSAETRLSAWVLALLPIAVGSFVIATSPRYFTAMWGDDNGRQLIYLAFALQAIGGFWLYRLARLR
ncbi:TPA: type II secretion system F family protein [Burkholderia cenocepacia]|jgi:tight adherence protein B|uniref:Pilus assembly protein n=2 Tax=Burkholderia cenocepacia TaxID=95486 RepID=A0A142PFX0_9BURK|nr:MULTISPECIES: type II secretion system F family protein [Burkholderia]AIO47691.1 type II secretion system (T2SS), F family protein [Burkholderia cepacia]ALV55423.1 pilus assembly protein [Burkholderia cenocepacia]AMU14913.1 pilus assembly protein [Burkholderia cenocepacia]AOK34197.1 pilus assembly protein [Burkholderia cenocepacia]AQQ42405.1 pilus assembly protein [Burkholderia cenocepacia]